MRKAVAAKLMLFLRLADLNSLSLPRCGEKMKQEVAKSEREGADWESAAKNSTCAAFSTWPSGFETIPRDEQSFSKATC